MTEQQFIAFLKANRCKLKFEKNLKANYSRYKPMTISRHFQLASGKSLMLSSFTFADAPERYGYWSDRYEKFQTYIKSLENE